MNIIKIENFLDPRLEQYHNIRERDLISKNNRFIAEGKVVLSVLLSSQTFVAESVLVLESRLQGLMPILQSAPDKPPVYTVTQDIIDKIAGFSVHRGILAVGKYRHSELSMVSFGKDTLVVVMAGLSNHDNVGAVFRNAAAFSADAIFLDEQSCNPLYRKALRVSVGAVLKVPFMKKGTLNEIVDELIAEDFLLAALSPSGEKNITKIPRSGRRALILGSEGEGLPKSLLAKIGAWKIPMASDFDSLNVATASAIALFHASSYV